MGDVTSTRDPVLLFLHGRYGLRDDLAWLAQRTPKPWRPILLEGSLALGDRFEWFRVADEDGRAAYSAEVAPAADELLGWIDAHAAGATVAAVGWSQGGATALHAMRRAPERLAFVVTLGGFTTLDAEVGDDELALRRPPVFWGHGENDDVIIPSDRDRMREFLPAHSTVAERIYPGVGHEISPAMAEDALRFIAVHAPPQRREEATRQTR